MRQILTRQISDVDALFDLIHRFADRHALAPDLERDLGIIAEELFTNQVRHARPGGRRIKAELSLVGDEVRLVLIDEDVDPFDPTAVPEPEFDVPIERRRPGGLGIHFVRTLSDSFDWTYDARRRISRTTVTRRLER